MNREALGLSLGLGIAPGRMPVPRGRGQRADDGEGMKLPRQLDGEEWILRGLVQPPKRGSRDCADGAAENAPELV